MAILANPRIVGHARGIDIVTSRVGSVEVTLGVQEQLRFFSGEVFGLLFVLLSSIYILFVPESMTRQGLVKGIMRRIIKRGIDITGALVGLVLTLPIWLVLPFLIKLDSSGSVFYSQLRVGENRRRRSRRFHPEDRVEEQRRRDRRRENHLGKPFRMLKFRTMVTDAELSSGPVWAAKNDNRITRLGHIMRKMRLDEIPQFINILKGEMSLVGPRPERPVFVKDLSTKVTDYSNRLEVRPGLTGLAQVENGYDDSLESVARKVEYDLQYIDQWSMWVDFKILCRTVLVVFTGRGAY